MKKGRPGTIFLALCRSDDRDGVLAAILKHTSTLGVRETRIRRTVLDREATVNSELLLIKLANREREKRNDILDAASAFEAKIMEYNRDAIILQLVGDTLLIDNFVDLMRDYEILESCRTGVISLSRGVDTMRDKILGK